MCTHKKKYFRFTTKKFRLTVNSYGRIYAPNYITSFVIA